MRIVASAVFNAGSVPLQVGGRYILAFRGSDLLVLGPVDVAPDRVAVTRRIADVDVVGMADGLLITDREPAGDRLALSFGKVLGRTAEGVERLILAERGDAGLGKRGDRG